MELLVESIVEDERFFVERRESLESLLEELLEVLYDLN